jgi:hypothetical protein
MRKSILRSVAIVVAFCAASQAQSTQKKDTGSGKERLIEAWRLARIEAPGSDGNATQPKGMLIYTRDGHMSVQLMYPRSASTLSNEYVKDGYEASFGSYDVDEATNMVTHHVQGSVTRDLLVGKDLPRVYQFTEDGHLIIKSSRPDEHWSVTWEHY